MSAEIVLPCGDLDATLAYFVDLGFLLDAIYPAENPSVAVVSGFGVRLRLDRDRSGSPGVLRLTCHEPTALSGEDNLVAPNGTVIEIHRPSPELVLPPLTPSLVITRAEDTAWIHGRAGMRYRDLIPDRQGGRFVASNIRVPDGGEVPDYVHYHRVHFQIIYCAKGWVRVVYEDQGPPFVLQAGDCVVQPPEIRHRVLESSPGMAVVELGCPALHETLADHSLALPTDRVQPERRFQDQRFVRHQAATADWGPWRLPGFEARDTGIATATNGVGGVRVARVAGGTTAQETTHKGDLLFLYVLQGTTSLIAEGQEHSLLSARDAMVLPPNAPFALTRCSRDLELLEITLPG